MITRLFLLTSFFLLADWLPARSQTIGAMLEQIAALYGYRYLTDQGYKTQEEGLGSIGYIQQSAYGLYDNYLTSLGSMNPVLNALPDLSALDRLRTGLASSLSASWSIYRQSAWLSGEEKDAISKTYTLLMARLTQTAAIIDALTAGDNFTMTDGERIHYIESAHTQIVKSALFLAGLMARTNALIESRNKEAATIRDIRQLYNIQP